MKKETIGHSKVAVEDFNERRNKDYKKLSLSDKKAFDQINLCLKALSDNGMEYWETYYNS